MSDSEYEEQEANVSVRRCNLFPVPMPLTMAIGRCKMICRGRSHFLKGNDQSHGSGPKGDRISIGHLHSSTAGLGISHDEVIGCGDRCSGELIDGYGVYHLDNLKDLKVRTKWPFLSFEPFCCLLCLSASWTDKLVGGIHP